MKWYHRTNDLIGTFAGKEAMLQGLQAINHIAIVEARSPQGPAQR
jgi:hypothetical protein